MELLYEWECECRLNLVLTCWLQGLAPTPSATLKKAEAVEKDETAVAFRNEI